MNKQTLFKPIDVVIYFNAAIFLASGILALNANSSHWIVFFILSVVNIIYVVTTIRLRRRYNKEFLKKIELEIIAETGIDESARKIVNRAKQDLLERRIEAEILEKIENAKVIRNAYIPKSDGNYSEIDLIVICKQGIYIIESKNIVGKITGSWKEDSLSISHPGGKDYPMPNPIKQNTFHYQYLKNILGLKQNLFRSVVVFGDLAYIDNYRDVPSFAQICKLDTLIKAMTKLANRYNTNLEEHVVYSTYETLLPHVKKTESKEKQHLNRIKELKNNQ